MLDASVVDLCAQCLAAAVAEESGENQLALCATAFARDLMDTHGAAAPELLEVAWHQACQYLDESELDAPSFAAALARLASLRADVADRLQITFACVSS